MAIQETLVQDAWRVPRPRSLLGRRVISWSKSALRLCGYALLASAILMSLALAAVRAWLLWNGV